MANYLRQPIILFNRTIWRPEDPLFVAISHISCSKRPENPLFPRNSPEFPQFIDNNGTPGRQNTQMNIIGQIAESQSSYE
ncbi:MAG: hypothetical protein ACE3L7_13415 [Candidatus Pristimantibacillus sp.]